MQSHKVTFPSTNHHANNDILSFGLRRRRPRFRSAIVTSSQHTLPTDDDDRGCLSVVEGVLMEGVLVVVAGHP
eukprot:scaffold3474_cov50-Cyclotella_meneghiniana.AAC.1